MAGSKRLITIVWFVAALTGLAATLFISVSYGAKDVTLETVWAAVFHYDEQWTTHQVVHDIRLPRVLGAAVTGMAFAIAGAIMQGITRNPMADTGILGVNAGAAFVVALSFAFIPSVSYSTLIVLAFFGAGLTTIFIMLLGSVHSPLRLTIAGAVVAAILQSLSTGIAIYFQLSQDLAFWYAGGVGGIGWEHLRLLAPIVFIVAVWAVMLGRPITFLSLGDDSAVSLGVSLNAVRLQGMTAAVLLAGSAVAVAGSIGFVGLVAPHIARWLVGIDYRKRILMSALLGATLLVWADFASRMVNPPREFAIGAMVALVGVPFFLYIARKERREL
ncbi:iron ABC transporter permease [Alkalihalobacillus oceani]|uniref:Iron ABC transporter permease n=1 Tax=Halalkalibacter oceani TaxID=1653776 RepID=A0A9X2DLQ0_9BACI|nr:iron ABC transporter permease [Halalkalibacter oceani]MCM3712874.1 iron ABC transporter permease [Halalkalibacter oceani]